MAEMVRRWQLVTCDFHAKYFEWIFARDSRQQWRPSVLRETVYRSNVADVDGPKTRLIDEWAQFDQSIVDTAISQYGRRLSAFVSVRGAHQLEHKF